MPGSRKKKQAGNWQQSSAKNEPPKQNTTAESVDSTREADRDGNNNIESVETVATNEEPPKEQCIASSGETPCEEVVAPQTNNDTKVEVEVAPQVETTTPEIIDSTGEAHCDGNDNCESLETAATNEQPSQGQFVASSGETPCGEIDTPPTNTDTKCEIASAEQVGSSGEAPCEEGTSLLADKDTTANNECTENAGSSGEAPTAPKTEIARVEIGISEHLSGSGEAPTDSIVVDDDPKGDDDLMLSLDHVQGGGSGEAPLNEEIDEEVQQNVIEERADLRVVDKPCQDVKDDACDLQAGTLLAGDYYWSNGDSNVECVLRIRPTGQWHHSAHRTSSERGRIVDPKKPRQPKEENRMPIHKAYKLHGLEDEPSTDMGQFKGDYEEFEVWELAEAVGSWREVQVRSTRHTEEGESEVIGTGVLLTCENCSWKTNHANAPLTYCPSDAQREEIESMFESGELVTCFKFWQCEDTGKKQLELHMDLSTVSEWTGVHIQELPQNVRIRSLQTSFQTLGLTRLYNNRPGNS